MTANSVSGSFRGIEVSFSQSGPHIVMSVLNTGEEGRRLRVMFQQQPLSGRVNWTSFQLTGMVQDVVVPLEVIHSHKLAFYVDSHEPIATYTEKILEELKQISSNNPVEMPETSSEPTAENQTLETPNVVEEIDDTENQQQGIDDVNSVTQNNSSIPQHIDDVVPEEIQESEPENAYPEMDVAANVESEISDNSVGIDGNHPSKNDIVQEGINAEESDDSDIPKRRSQYIGDFLPDVSTELKFKIKVPTMPKSATKKQTNFIPPRPSIDSNGKNKKNGVFAQLAGVMGFSSHNKKKQYYLEQNKHIHDKFHANLEKLESDYNTGSGIPLDNWDLDSLDEQQTVILLLNLMVNEISAWQKDAQKNSKTKETLAENLKKIEEDLKQTLKQTRGIDAPAPTLFPDRTASSDKDLEHIQKDCDSYLNRFSKKLASLEQKHAEKVRVSVFKKFLLEFVRDELFPTVVEYSSLKSVQTRLNWFLSLVDYELIPIEPGKTKFSPNIHEAKEKRSSEFESDTIVEVISPGIQLKGGKRIIQNAVVVQAE
ncbi:hypothetical protein F4212_04635 [Candidatus Poribacteria bacterium]|nr:hypothetical protein [Candidatus Poribacteria bacterium]